MTHNVVDVDKWLSFSEERAGAVTSMGGRNVLDMVARDGSNLVLVSADVDDADALVAAIESAPPELQEVMQRHGVIMPFTTFVEK
jgi:hypothetical protein